MTASEVPLTPNNQQFRIQLGNATLTLQVIWRDAAGWILDVMDSGGSPLLLGAPLVPGLDLLEQYPELGIGGALMVSCDNGAPEYPTQTNLGSFSHLIFVQE
jgi:hypothetical protein